MESKKALKVSLFPTCVAGAFCPAVTKSSIALIESAGYEVTLVAPNACCGQPAYSAGRIRSARKVAASALSGLTSDTNPIVVPSGSCTAMIRKAWPVLFATSPKRHIATSVAERTIELTEFLFSIDPSFDEPTGDPPTVAFHDSCHGLRELGLGPQARHLLRKAGYRVIECENPQLCCGFGGIFSQLIPELSTKIGAQKAAMLAAVAPLVTASDAACLIHLSESLEQNRPHKDSDAASRRTDFRHIAEVLAQRLSPGNSRAE